jgi:hypothetical protein
MRLRVSLHPNWEQLPIEKGPWALKKRGLAAGNVLQLSFLENKSRKPVNFSLEQMADVAIKQATGMGGRVSATAGGPCPFGKVAIVRFATDVLVNCQTFVLHNGVHLITATYFCAETPSAEELREVEHIVSQLGLNELQARG